MTGTLIGDIGGTNARFFVYDGGALDPEMLEDKEVVLSTAAFGDLVDAIPVALSLIGAEQTAVDSAVLAVAGPVSRDEMHLTNASWQPVHAGELARTFHWSDVHFVNDVVAAAAGLATFRHSIRAHTIRAAAANPAARTALVNVGTGLGVAYFTANGNALRLESSEAGHMGYAPQTAEEMRRRTDMKTAQRVSWEQVLAGAGLARLHTARTHVRAATSRAVVSAAAAGDPFALASISEFCRLLGSFVGDLVLGAPATGGIWLTGGVITGMDQLFDNAGFIGGVDDKGPMRSLVSSVPLARVSDSNLGLLGGIRLANERSLLMAIKS